jgi:hypothetical protein
MKKRKNTKWPLIGVALAILCFSSCVEQWGQMDPPAGNQVYPRLEKLAELKFNEELNPDEIQSFAHDGGNLPAIVNDGELGKVLHLDGGYLGMANPLLKAKVQNGVSLTFWAKQSDALAEQDSRGGALFSFQDESGSRMFFTAEGGITYHNAEEGFNYVSSPGITAGEWHYLAVAITNTGFSIYVDGEALTVNHNPFETSSQEKNPLEEMVQFMATAPYLYIGTGSGSGVEPGEWWLDDLSVYRNVITSKEIAAPTTSGGNEFQEVITIGETDFSTGWWSAFSELISATGDCMFHYTFKNYTSGANNWENWVLVVTNGKAFGEEGYAEHFVLRADAYGWGSAYNGDNITHNYNWDTFKNDMHGATVDLTLKRVAGRVEMTAVTTTTGGQTFTYTYFAEGITGALGTFFTLEKAYLEIQTKEVYVGNLYEIGQNRLGEADNSTGWWGAHSALQSFDGNGAIKYQFYNYGNGGGNWNNWVLVLTNGIAIGSEGVAEYIVLRADNFGWGTYYVGENLSNNFNWDTFIADMQGAFVDLTIRRIDTRLDVIVKVTTTSGGTLNYSYFHDDFPTGPLGTCFTTDGSHLDFISISKYPFIK